MSLFHFGKAKKKDTQTMSQNLAAEEINALWTDAYQASPKVYEKEDGTLLVAFALTEDCDSLFPVIPEKQWALKDKVISEWMINMVSITNLRDGIIGQMEYHEAMNRLTPFIIAQKDNWVLIRKMTHQELDSLFGDLPRNLY